MRFDYKTFLHNKYILYLLFVFVLLQLIVFLQCGEMNYAAILLITGAIFSYFNKNMIIVLFSTLIVTHLVKWVLSGGTIKEGLDVKSNDTGSSTSDPTVNMSSKDIKQAIEEQDTKIKELASDINNMYLKNQTEISTLVSIKKDLENKQAVRAT